MYFGFKPQTSSECIVNGYILSVIQCNSVQSWHCSVYRIYTCECGVHTLYILYIYSLYAIYSTVQIAVLRSVYRNEQYALYTVLCARMYTLLRTVLFTVNTIVFSTVCIIVDYIQNCIQQRLLYTELYAVYSNAYSAVCLLCAKPYTVLCVVYNARYSTVSCVHQCGFLYCLQYNIAHLCALHMPILHKVVQYILVLQLCYMTYFTSRVHSTLFPVASNSRWILLLSLHLFHK